MLAQKLCIMLLKRNPNPNAYFLERYCPPFCRYRVVTKESLNYPVVDVDVQDLQRGAAEPVPGVARRHEQLHPGPQDGRRHHPLRRRAHVDLLPVHDQCGPPEDPHRHAHYHLQEDLRQHGHAVEVSRGRHNVSVLSVDLPV